MENSEVTRCGRRGRETAQQSCRAPKGAPPPKTKSLGAMASSLNGYVMLLNLYTRKYATHFRNISI